MAISPRVTLDSLTIEEEEGLGGGTDCDGDSSVPDGVPLGELGGGGGEPELGGSTVGVGAVDGVEVKEEGDGDRAGDGEGAWEMDAGDGAEGEGEGETEEEGDGGREGDEDVGDSEGANGDGARAAGGGDGGDGLGFPPFLTANTTTTSFWPFRQLSGTPLMKKNGPDRSRLNIESPPSNFWIGLLTLHPS
ncbi:hypothetical protein B296_00057160 [Ensete ventricosum]|uniref:Uncharacterized protein n=1 Tax=Ensete ventricosum TaxID=4639 RepID=A0A426XSL2_ENSVE|nr:hypothetical protein B296_00057160 [Ensete ventricosum]